MLRIYVGRRDIKHGTPNNSMHCPIASAVRRKTHKHVSIGDHEIHITSCKGSICRSETYVLPKSAREFIHSFDNGSKVNIRPFSFRAKKL
jgi:hypothetical protein